MPSLPLSTLSAEREKPPVQVIDPIHVNHSHLSHDRGSVREVGHGRDAGHGSGRSVGGLLLGNCCEEIRVQPARPGSSGSRHGGHGDLHAELAHLDESWLSRSPGHLEIAKARLVERFETAQRWTFDLERWKPTTGLDELAFFWNDLPRDSEVELYLPGINVEEVFNFRSLRHAPGTVRIVDSQTLRLLPVGTTYLPFARLWGDNLAGLLKVALPAGIRKGQRFKIDVVQMRADEARTLGGFQVNIQVEKAFDLWEAEARTLELFHKRLSLKPKTDRWWPIVSRQVEFTRARAEGLVDLANEENPAGDPIDWNDPTRVQQGRKVRVVLEKIQITDDREPFFKGKGEFRFSAKAWTPNNGGITTKRAFPEDGCFRLSDLPGSNEVELNAVLFEDWVEDELAVQVGGFELDTFDPDDRLDTFKRLFQGAPESWFGSYAPTGAAIDAQDMDGWRIWLRIEPS